MPERHILRRVAGVLIAAVSACRLGAVGGPAPPTDPAGDVLPSGGDTSASGDFEPDADSPLGDPPGAGDAGTPGDGAGGDDSTACSATLSDPSLPLCDGTYTQEVLPGTFAPGAVIRAQHSGGVRFTGGFSAGTGLTFRGIVIDNGDQKLLGDGNVYEEMSFVGGPPCGNSVNSAIGAGTTVRKSAFYGAGGRYQVLAYQVSGVVLEDVLIRSDGGWGEGGGACNEWEPNAAMNIYDSSDFVCRRCVLFDGIATASAESETLGGLGVNCHGTATSLRFEHSLIVDSQGGFWADGHGTCADVGLDDCRALRAAGYGLKRNVSGTTTATRFSTDSGCGVWTGTVLLVDSSVSGGNDGCSGSLAGTGGSPTLDADFLGWARWRRELCDLASVTRGWCGTSLSLLEYLQR